MTKQASSLSREETAALRIIKEFAERDRPVRFNMARLGIYNHGNPIIASLTGRGLLITTPRTIKLTPKGEQQLLWAGRLATISSKVASRWLRQNRN